MSVYFLILKKATQNINVTDMNTKEKTTHEIEKRLNKIEKLIAEKGVGANYLNRAERIQRDINIALFAGSVGVMAGIGVWAWFKLKD